jgi:hypothetical protein
LLVLNLVFIVLFQLIMIYFYQGLRDTGYLIKISFSLILGKLISMIISSQSSNFESIMAIKSIYKINCFIFDKILKTSPSSNQKKSNQGEIINYLQVDSGKVAGLLRTLPKMVIYPIQIVIYIYVLFSFLGYSFIFGIITLISFIVFNYFVSAYND